MHQQPEATQPSEPSSVKLEGQPSRAAPQVMRRCTRNTARTMAAAYGCRVCLFEWAQLRGARKLTGVCRSSGGLRRAA